MGGGPESPRKVLHGLNRENPPTLQICKVVPQPGEKGKKKDGENVGRERDKILL